MVFCIEVMPIWFQDIRHLSDVAAPQSRHESGQHERTVVERQIRAIGRTVSGESALQARRCLSGLVGSGHWACPDLRVGQFS
jgi:hypothetical protein